MSRFDRVSGFLQAPHFFEPLHGKLFEVMGKLIGMGKHASPITLKTFFDSEPPIGELTVPQYLGRLAAAATTIINAAAYGRVIYDLAVRRELIVIGGDMVNVGLQFAGGGAAGDADRGGRAAAVRPCRQGQVRLGLHGVWRRDGRGGRDGGQGV